MLIFNRKDFTNVILKEIEDSLYDKILSLKNNEFFELIPPYALIILRSNIEVQEFSVGDMITADSPIPFPVLIYIN